MRLEGRAAIVSGGAQGIGKAIAAAFVSEGARVLIADINGERAQQTAHELGASGDDDVVRSRTGTTVPPAV